MAIRRVLAFFLVLAIALVYSCVRVPMEFTLKNDIILSEKDMKKIRADIKKALSQIDFKPKRPSASFDSAECNRAYQKWLERQFEEIGYLPRRNIVPEIDFKPFSRIDLKECRTVDYEVEYRERSEDAYDEAAPKIFLSSLESQAQTLNESKCGKRFLDRELGKIILSSMDILISKNTLNFSAPSYKIYTSNKYLTVDDFNVSEKDLVESKTLLLLARTPRVPARSKGKFFIRTISDFARYQEAVLPLTSFGGSLVGYPDGASFGPQVTSFDGVDHFIVPSGEFRAEVHMIFEFVGTLKDVSCAYYDFIDKIKKHERERESGQAI